MFTLYTTLTSLFSFAFLPPAFYPPAHRLPPLGRLLPGRRLQRGPCGGGGGGHHRLRVGADERRRGGRAFAVPPQRASVWTVGWEGFVAPTYGGCCFGWVWFWGKKHDNRILAYRSKQNSYGFHHVFLLEGGFLISPHEATQQRSSAGGALTSAFLEAMDVPSTELQVGRGVGGFVVGGRRSL